MKGAKEANSYTFDWRLKEQAHVTALLLREHFGTGSWRVAKWVVIGIVVLSALFAAGLALLGDVASAMTLAPLLLLLGVLLAVFYRLTGWLRAWQVQRIDPNVAHPLTHTLDEAGLHVSAQTVNVDLKWAGLHKVRETPAFFLFYYSRRWAYYLPKRACVSEAEVERLRAWIRAQLPPGVPYDDEALRGR